ncbi:hypothetical protein KR018_007062 [Drosophila ironensis]|nr:hypothetical protein KR018_007062 [Drosophila ironensis]
MGDKNKENPPEERENAATDYGLEDQEATQNDPRVHTLRAAESRRRHSLTKTPVLHRSEVRIATANLPPAPTNLPPDTPVPTSHDANQNITPAPSEKRRTHPSEVTIATTNLQTAPTNPEPEKKANNDYTLHTHQSAVRMPNLSLDADNPATPPDPRSPVVEDSSYTSIRKPSNPNAAVGYGMEAQEANAQDARVINLQDEHRRHHHLPDRALETMPKPEQENLPKSVPEHVPERVPERVPEHVPERVPEHVPEHVPGPVPGPVPKPVSKPVIQHLAEPPPKPVPEHVPEPPPKPERTVKTDGSAMDPNSILWTLQERQIPVILPEAEDVPMPPPVMSEQKIDLFNWQTKMTNTDCSFDPSKAYSSKCTNTSPFASETNITDESDGYDSELGDMNVPDVVAAEDLDNLYLLACCEVRKAGIMALETQNDKDKESVEQMLITVFSSRYPDHKFIGKEQITRSETGACNLTNAPTWIINAFDSEVNYANKFPYYCISVAYLVDKVTQFGIIFNPPMCNMYTAMRGKGALLNQKAMRTSGQTDLSSALILQEYTDNQEQSTIALENARMLSSMAQAVRELSSPAMCLALVASGAADAYYNFGLHIWDLAAGQLIVEEAGGVVLDPTGTQVDIMSRRCLAASSHRLAELVSTDLEQTYPRPRDDENRNTSKWPAKLEMDHFLPVKKEEVAKKANPKKDFSCQTDFPDSEESGTSVTDDPKSPGRNLA